MSEPASPTTSRTDWARVDALLDEEIDTSEVPPLSEAFFQRARLRSPSLVSVTVRVEPEVLAWFQAQGERAEGCLTAALRSYVEAHRPA